jgi:thiamine biosynthesis lipoprotein
VRAITIFSLLFVFALLPARSGAVLREVREVHYQMGTSLELIVWHSEPEKAHRLIRDAVQYVHRLDLILSNYDPDSALSRLNELAGKGATRVPLELFELLKTARAFSENTGGIFDVTVGRLMELWSKAAETNRLPSGKQLTETLAAVGYRNVVLHGTDEVELADNGTKIDLGGIGKGFAVDYVAERLRAQGITSALINFGGSSIAAIGTPPRKPGWEVAVQGADGRLRGTLCLRDRALSTSGSMGRSWIIEGKKYGHLINPLTGFPVTEGRVATVLAASATQAEALTKPLILLGKNALPIVNKFSDSEAVVMPESGAPLYSRRFRSMAFWKNISKP